MVNFDSVNLPTHYEQQNIAETKIDDSIYNGTSHSLPLDMLENLNFSSWVPTGDVPFNFLGPRGYDEFLTAPNLEEFFKIYEFGFESVYHDHCYCKEQPDLMESDQSNESPGHSISSDDDTKNIKIQPIPSRKRKAPNDSVDNKRVYYNKKERLRRETLNDAYELLQNSIPELEGLRAIPKIKILTVSTEYCKILQRKAAIQKKELKELKSRNSKLRELYISLLF